MSISESLKARKSMELGMVRSIARFDGLAGADLRDRLEPEDTRDMDDDDAAEDRGEPDANVSGAPPKSGRCAEGADRDGRPGSAARGVASASGPVASASGPVTSPSLAVMLCEISTLLLISGLDPDSIQASRRRLGRMDDSGSGVGYGRFCALPKLPGFSGSPSQVS